MKLDLPFDAEHRDYMNIEKGDSYHYFDGESVCQDKCHPAKVIRKRYCQLGAFH